MNWPKISSAKLHRENHCGVFPLCSIGNRTYEVEDGWSVVGWSDAPWVSAGQTTAVVFEKHCSPREYDDISILDPGLYWLHGDIFTMTFVGLVLAAPMTERKQDESS